MNLGGGSTAGVTPRTPVAPTTGNELDNADVVAGSPSTATSFSPRTLQIVATGAGTTHTITSNNGDIVINGTLIAERSTGTTTNSITLSAPAGTVFIHGTVQATGTPGVIDNPDGGTITINAARVVVTGYHQRQRRVEPRGAGGERRVDRDRHAGISRWATSGSTPAGSPPPAGPARAPGSEGTAGR